MLTVISMKTVTALGTNPRITLHHFY